MKGKKDCLNDEECDGDTYCDIKIPKPYNRPNDIHGKCKMGKIS